MDDSNLGTPKLSETTAAPVVVVDTAAAGMVVVVVVANTDATSDGFSSSLANAVCLLLKGTIVLPHKLRYPVETLKVTRNIPLIDTLVIHCKAVHVHLCDLLRAPSGWVLRCSHIVHVRVHSLDHQRASDACITWWWWLQCSCCSSCFSAHERRLNQ